MPYIIFNSIKNFVSENTIIKSKNITDINAYFHNSGLSCFQTIKKYIMCFILNNSREYIIIAFDEFLNEMNRNQIDTLTQGFENPFYKCIHLKEEIGVFAYYLYQSNYYLSIVLKEYEENTGEIKNFSISQIILDEIRDNYRYLLSNDIVRLNKNKIFLCFFSSSSIYFDFVCLHIIEINFFEDKYYKIRYYLIDLKNQNKIKIYSNLEAHIYNNLLVLGFNYNGDQEIGIHEASTGLLIFSYSNSTDNYLYLDNYLYNYTYNNITINLTKEVRIENNIFGYAFSGIEIVDLFQCNNLKFYSLLNKKQIYPNYTLEKNESINLEIIINGSVSIENFTCILQYRYKVIEQI